MLKELKNIIFCTSVGGGVFGEKLVEEWNKHGYCAHMDYLISLDKYWREKSKSNRLCLRLSMYVFYPLSIFLRSFFVKKSIFIVTTNPFFLPALLFIPSRIRGHKIINLVYDLYPESIIHGGGVSPNSFTAKTCEYITKFSVRKLDHCIYLSENLGNYIEQKYGPSRGCSIISPGATTFSGDVIDKKIHSRKNSPVQILYSGHMGKLHDWETILRVLQSGELLTIACEKIDIYFQITANGPGIEKIKENLSMQWDEPVFINFRGVTIKVLFTSTLPNDEWVEAMECADIALVSLTKGGECSVMPSKTYSALLAGQAILGISQESSDLAKIVTDNKCGWIVENGDVDYFIQILHEIMANSTELFSLQQNALSYGEDNHSYEKVAQRYVKIFEAL